MPCFHPPTFFHRGVLVVSTPLIDMAQVDQIFDLVDSDKNGSLDAKELLIFFRGKGVDEDVSQKIFLSYDNDKSGTIDKGEFRSMCEDLNAYTEVFKTCV